MIYIPKHKSDKARVVFFLSPLLLILFVFCVTFVFRNFLPPLLLSIPLMVSYYGYIWFSMFWYRRTIAGNESVFKDSEFRPGFHGLAPWMIIWNFVYPMAAGIIIFSIITPHLSAQWILLGVPFALINGPSEEIYWRLFLERSGTDGVVLQKIRLWYSSAVFSLWHFIYLFFLMPRGRFMLDLMIVLPITLVTGLLWMLVYQKTRNIFSNIFCHAAINFLFIWPWGAAAILGVNPLPF